jgi:type II secretory pathway pseudopilin PulG
MRRLIAAARDERGFTMVTVMAVMFCVTLLSIAALSAAQGDLKPGAHDKSRKVAYAAAEAGVQNYLFHLSQDPNYWAKCTTGALPNAINDPWNGVSPAVDPRRWRTLPASSSRYTIELMPANATAACSTANPEGTMLDTGTGTFQIRATGQDVTTGVKRSLIVTMKRKSFLDYLYFTDKEARSPGLYSMETDGSVTRENVGAGRDIVTWAKDQCQRYWGNDPTVGNRDGQFFDGEVFHASTGTWGNFDLRCKEGGFAAQDNLRGPVHTNDELFIDCGSPSPVLGDSLDDPVETSALGQLPTTPADPDAGWHGCQAPDVNFSTTATPRPAGTWKSRAAPLTLPPTNSALKHDTAANYRFKGTTKIVLSATTMTVTGTREDGTVLTSSAVSIPADGVVYVANDGSCPEYTPLDSARLTPSCGNLELDGNYAANVTFTAENDILVKGSITRTASGSPFLLGLIATNYVRIHHPVTGCSPASTCNFLTGCTNAAGTPTNVSIDAAILSLTKSLVVDNWFCGSPLGTLRLYGAIAQLFRGPVNRVNTTTGASFGYEKDYTYDTKLKYRSPPYFLDPVQAQWRVQTFSEQAPAR